MLFTQSKLLDFLIGCGLVGILVLPSLITSTYYPVIRFYPELIALTFSGFIGLIAVYKMEYLRVSSVAIAAFLFIQFIVLQIFVAHVRIPGINLVVAIEFLFGLVLSIGVTSYINSDELELKKFTRYLMWVIAISATIQALFGYLQLFGVARSIPWIVLFAGNHEVFGNLAQKNDYADFISLGLFAILYLGFNHKIKPPVLIIWVIFIELILTFSISRSPILFFMLIFIYLSVLIFVHKADLEKKQLLYKILKLVAMAFAAFVVIELIVPKLSSLIWGYSMNSGVYRLGEGVGFTTYRRFYEWWKDLVIFWQYPWFGVGWYQYPKAAVDLMLSPTFMYIPASTEFYSHSHDTPLNMLAETGIIGFTITMVYGVGYSFYRMIKNFDTVETIFIQFLILTIFGQSLLQYPLWYAYFLMPFILFLSCDRPIFSIKNHWQVKVWSTVLFVGFLFSAYLNSTVYNVLAQFSATPTVTQTYKHNIEQLTALIDNNTLWQYPGLLVLDQYMYPATPQTNEVIPNLLQQAHYIDMSGLELPFPQILFKQIIVHHAIGDTQVSNYYANILAHAYPLQTGEYEKILRQLPGFESELQTLKSFNYNDDSIWGEWFNPKK